MEDCSKPSRQDKQPRCAGDARTPRTVLRDGYQPVAVAGVPAKAAEGLSWARLGRCRPAVDELAGILPTAPMPRPGRRHRERETGSG